MNLTIHIHNYYNSAPHEEDFPKTKNVKKFTLPRRETRGSRGSESPWSPPSCAPGQGQPPPEDAAELSLNINQELFDVLSAVLCASSGGGRETEQRPDPAPGGPREVRGGKRKSGKL